MVKEIWKDIPGFDGNYQISSLGYIRSLVKSQTNLKALPRILKQTHHKTNTYNKIHLCKFYRTTTLRKKSKPITKYVHILMCETFIGPRPKGMEASHINGNPYDNRIANLTWETASENQARKIQHGTALIGTRNQATILSEEDVIAIKALRDRGYQCAYIAKHFGVTRAWVNLICTNPKRFRKYIRRK